MLKRLGILLILLLAVLGTESLTASPPEETLQILNDTPIPVRDPVDLAQRFRRVDPASFTFAVRPAYQVGQQETFFLAGSEGRSSQQLLMRLAAQNDQLYLWMEDGIAYDPAQVADLASLVASQIMPRIRSVFGAEASVPSDPRIYIFTVRDAGPGIAGFFNDTDRYPNELFSTSNEVNSFVMALNPRDTFWYVSTLAHEFQHLVQANLDEGDETWFIEGFAELGSLIAAPEFFGSVERQAGFVENATAIQLNTWAREGESSIEYYAAASLYLTYITQQYGEGWIAYVASEPTDGLIGIEQALADFGARDPQTGQPVSADSLFADFVAANYLNDSSIADGRFGYRLVAMPARAGDDLVFNSYPLELLDQTVNQYAAQYIALENPTPNPLTLRIEFTGQDSSPLLPTQPTSGQHFMWSQRGNQGNARLVGHFDLSNVPSASLTFSTWWDMEAFWDYGYLSVSRDNGQTWELITSAPDMTAENPYDRAFGVGFTAQSGPGSTRPAPFIGFSYEDSALQVTAIQAGTPGAVAGLQVGDILTALNDAPLTTSNFFTVLDQYRAGDSVTLSVERNGQPLQLPLTLGEHPIRQIQAPIEWSRETVDLTPYVGGEVLISFDYVTDQAKSYDGWLLDDVSIPEIGFMDDFESANPAWESQGWVRITDEIPQGYYVQFITAEAGAKVTRLLQPDQASQGVWEVLLGPGERGTLAISGIAAVTTLPARYELRVTVIEG
jgi:hypothetical protein